MNKLLLLLFLYFCLSSLPLSAKRVNITLEQPGTLKELLEKEDDITELIISGQMDASDFLAIIADETLSHTLTLIDISEVSITSLPDDAFYACDGLVTIILPKALVSLGSNAFTDCIRLKDVILPGTLRALGKYAFSGCQSLTAISIPEGITEIPLRAFDGCTSLKSITLPSSLQSIGSGAFALSGLLYAELPPNLKVIERDAFYNTSLKEVILPKSLQKIGVNAFTCCAGLESISVVDGNPCYGSVDGVLFNAEFTALLCYPAGKKNTVYEVPSSVTTLGELAFAGAYDTNGNPLHSYLTSIKLPEGLESIGESAFSTRVQLQHLELPASVKEIGNGAFFYTGLTQITIPEGIEKLASTLFYDCFSLREITLPQSLQVIEDFTFWNCSSLSSIHIPASVNEIGYSVFSGCTSLDSISIPEGIQTIYNGTFAGCTSLTQVHLPETLKTLEESFSNCSQLSHITLPASLEYFGLWTFDGCKSLRNICLLPETPPTTEDYDSIALPKDVVIYVPDKAVSTYKNNSSWGIFNIQPLSTSGIEAQRPKSEKEIEVLFNSDGEIQIRATQKGMIEIYSISGSLIHKFRIEPGESRLKKPTGIDRLLIVYTSGNIKSSFKL